MKQVSDKFKSISKKIKQQNLKVLIKETNEEIAVKELKYKFEGELFKTIMKEITFSVKNVQELEGKTIQVKYGLLVDNEYEYVDIGEYVVKDIEEDKKKEETSITCYDNMLKFMAAFNQDNLKITYPCTMLELVQKICQVCGVELYSTDFYNAELSVTEDFFTVQQLNYRDVLVKIAQSTLSTIFIKENKLYLCNLGNEVQTLDASYITAMAIEEKFGPINALVLGRGDVEDNIESIDQESIDTYGRCEIRFDENEFLDDKRETVIDAMLNQIKGIEFYAFESSDLGVTWLEPCDWIELQDRAGNIYKVLYLKGNITINTGITGQMSTDIPETTETEYKVTTEQQKKVLKVERLAKKNEGLIQDVIQENTEQNQKISKVTQTVDELNSKIQDIADITTFGESMYAKVELDSINESEPIQITVKPTEENISYLYPHENLYPSDDLYLKDRKIRFTNKTNDTYIDYILPDDLLIAPDGTYDEFYLGYDEQVCQVTKRCQYNADGTVSKLEKEQIISYDYPKIELKDGDYTIELLGYTNAYLSVRMMAQNIYTTQFATKAEVSSEISQKADEVNISVDKKLSNYSTTTQMNSAINVKANEITSNVGTTYATKGELNTTKSEIKQTTDSISSTVSKKVGNDEIISKINQSAEAVGIKADKIELSANDVLNLLAGNTINLSSKNIVISSDALTIKKDGTMILKGAGSATDIFRVQKTSDSSVFSYIQPIGAGYVNGSSDKSIYIFVGDTSSSVDITDINGNTYISGRGIRTPSVTQTSVEKDKKNFETLNNGLEIIKNTDIYKYNLKSQKDTDKKHIGFVIGDSYNYSKEITSENNDGVDTYSMISVAYKAIQELAQQNEQLQNEIKKLKGEK